MLFIAWLTGLRKGIAALSEIFLSRIHIPYEGNLAVRSRHKHLGDTKMVLESFVITIFAVVLLPHNNLAVRQFCYKKLKKKTGWQFSFISPLAVFFHFILL